MEHQKEQKEQGGGNTKSPPKHRKFCFTLNNWTENELEHIKKEFLRRKFKYIIGKETGEQGTPHLQMYIRAPSPVTFQSVKKINDRMHIEVAKGTDEHNLKYCSKDGNFETNLEMPEKVEIIEELRPWQKEIADLIQQKPDKRTIHWYWDPIGNIGKTELCKYLYIKYGIMYITGGKGSDILHVCTEALSKNPKCKTFILDFPRAIEGFVSYTAIEQIKNGFWTSTKYEGGTICINRPHVIIFANWEPEIEKFSADRWRIVKLE